MALKDWNGFKASSIKIDDIDLPRVGHEIGVGEDEIHAVMDVEAAGSGADSKGRIKMLYEPHVAYRCAPNKAVRDKLVAAGLAYPKWKKGYPKDSYPRLLKALAIDETTALKACSWGLFQILGENHHSAGYDTVQAMVKDFLYDEDNQLEAMIRFVVNNKLDDEIRAHNWAGFARGYNGVGYKANGYDKKLAAAYAKWAKIKDTPWSPDAPAAPAPDAFAHLYDGKAHEELRGMQQMLDDKGYPEVGAVDGKWGSKTRTAVLAFRADESLPTPDIERPIDSAFLTKLALSKGRVVAPERKNATVADLRKEGAEEIVAADKTQVAAGGAVGLGLLGSASKLVEGAEGYGGLVERVAKLIEPVQSFISDNLALIVIGVGGYIVWNSNFVKSIRLTKHRKAEDVSL